MPEIDYDYKIATAQKSLIDELWDHELQFIGHIDLVVLAKKSFQDDLKKYSLGKLLRHYNATIGR
jgi:hypothetical protein